MEKSGESPTSVTRKIKGISQDPKKADFQVTAELAIEADFLFGEEF